MRKIFTLFVAIFVIITFVFAKKDNLVIEYMSLEQQELALSRVGTIEFTEKYILLVDFQRDVIATQKIKDVRKISFTESSTSIADLQNVIMTVYPNPTMDALFVEGLSLGDILRIYTMDGVFIRKEIVDAEIMKILVDDLPLGSYILQSNMNVVKFIKK